METRQKRVNHIMFKIGYRTLKTALGTAIAIYIAQLLGLQNYSVSWDYYDPVYSGDEETVAPRIRRPLRLAVLPFYFLIYFSI